MASDRKVPPAPVRNPQLVGKTQLVNIPLRLLPDPSKDEDEFGHRFMANYQEDSLEDLIQSIMLHGLLEAPHVAKDKDGQWIIIGGHRRVAALYVMARRQVAGYSLDMEVHCLEVIGASQQELLGRSVAGNELAKRLEVKERLRATKKLFEAGASKKDIATSLGVSEKSIERDLQIVKHERVFQHVMNGDLSPTAASSLVEAAEAVGRLDEWLDHFDAYSTRLRQEIEEADRRARQERGKGLKPGQMKVESRLEPHVVRGWIEALSKGKPLTEQPGLGFEATFDKTNYVATIKVKVDAKTDPVEHLARVASQVSQVAKHLAKYARRRYELEGPEGPQHAQEQDDSFLDLDLLKDFGLDDVATQLEEQLAVEDASSADSATEENQNEATDGA